MFPLWGGGGRWQAAHGGCAPVLWLSFSGGPPLVMASVELSPCLILSGGHQSQWGDHGGGTLYSSDCNALAWGASADDLSSFTSQASVSPPALAAPRMPHCLLASPASGSSPNLGGPPPPPPLVHVSAHLIPLLVDCFTLPTIKSADDYLCTGTLFYFVFAALVLLLLEKIYC
jgi:hypothetical protein